MLLALQGWLLQQPSASWLPYARPGASAFRSRLTPSRTLTVLTPSRTRTIVRAGVGPNDEDEGMVIANFDFTVEQMLALNPSPPILVTGVLGFTHVPSYMVFYKTTSGVFTTTALSFIGPAYDVSPRVPAIGSAFAATLSTPAITSTTRHQGALAVLSGEAAGEVGGKDLVLWSDVALGGAGSPCSLLLAYRTVPTVKAA